MITYNKLYDAILMKRPKLKEIPTANIQISNKFQPNSTLDPNFRYIQSIPLIKTKRKNLSCLSCRISHLSCDGERPCSRCLKKCNPESCVDAPKPIPQPMHCPTPTECEKNGLNRPLDGYLNGFEMMMGNNGVMSMTPLSNSSFPAQNIGSFWKESQMNNLYNTPVPSNPIQNTNISTNNLSNNLMYTSLNDIQINHTFTTPLIYPTTHNQSAIPLPSNDSGTSHTTTLFDEEYPTGNIEDMMDVCYSSQFAMDIAARHPIITTADLEYQSLFEHWVEKNAPGVHSCDMTHSYCGNCPFKNK